MKHSTIEFNRDKHDFVINGKPLLTLIEKHEDVIADRHLVSVLSQPGACDRLLGLSEPDLQNGHVAIYLCSHCGGYDGNPIGIKLVLESDHVIWKDIGFYQDYEDEDPQLFHKVKDYSFTLQEYRELLQRLKIYEP